MLPIEAAQFPGGNDKIPAWIEKNIKYPVIAKKSRIEGKVYIEFMVGVDGYIANVQILKGVSSSLNKEAIRIIKAMPKWKPGKIRGKVVSSIYNMSITFHLSR